MSFEADGSECRRSEPSESKKKGGGRTTRVVVVFFQTKTFAFRNLCLI